MRTDTPKLIESLSRDLTPVTALRSLPRRAAAWLGPAALFVAAGVWMAGVRPDLSEKWRDGVYWFGISALLGGGLFAGLAALLGSVPGRSNAGVGRGAVALVGSWGLLLAGQTAGTAGLTGWSALNPGGMAGCAVIVSAGAIPLAGLLFYAIRSAAPTAPGTCGALAAFASASFAALGLQFVCDADRAAHTFTWHFLPIVIVTALGAWIGRRAFAALRNSS